ncbi:hypothetical protein DMENIID0001_074190 [Sergentomyia squamirostris]
MLKVEYRAVIKFLTKEGYNTKEVKKQLDDVYGSSSPSYSTVKLWAKLIKSGRDNVDDIPRGGRTSETYIDLSCKKPGLIRIKLQLKKKKKVGSGIKTKSKR